MTKFCPEIPSNLIGEVKYFESLPANIKNNCRFKEVFSSFTNPDLYKIKTPLNTQPSETLENQLNWPPKLYQIQAQYLPFLNGYDSYNYKNALFEPEYFYDPTTYNDSSCQQPTPGSTVAFIICFRDRYQHLEKFLTHTLPILIRQQLKFKIYLIEQTHEKSFNRAKLFNIGYDLAKNDPVANFDCYTFHDVDLLLMNDNMLFRCNYDNLPRHLVVNLVKFDDAYSNVPYKGIFGGAVQIPGLVFEKVNGYSNKYFGWGGEDDDLSLRLYDFNRVENFNMIRPDKNIAKYRMIEHKSDVGNKRNAFRFKLLRDARKRWQKDGLNSLKYQVVEQKNFGIFMRYTVNL